MTKEMEEQKYLQSARITLRAPEPTDIDFMFHIENDTRMWNVSACKTPYSRYLLHKYITETSHDIYTDRQLRLMIETTNGEIAGAIDLIDFNPTSRRAEVGIVIEKERRGKGYANETLELVKQYASEILDLHQLYAYVFTDNLAACKLFKNAGFSVTAELKDWEFRNKKYRDVYLFQLILEQ